MKRNDARGRRPRRPAWRARRQPPRRARVTVQLLATATAVAFGLSACGDGSASPGVASIGSTTRTTEAPSSLATGDGTPSGKYRAALAYSSCMRSHGVGNFPDPSSNGTLSVKFATGGKDGAPRSSGIDRMSSQYLAADRSCRHLLPGGVPTPAQTRQALADALKFAQCMRGHGVENFPDPNPTSPGVVHLAGVDPGSPRFQSAQRTCESLVPGTGSK